MNVVKKTMRLKMYPKLYSSHKDKEERMRRLARDVEGSEIKDGCGESEESDADCENLSVVRR